MKVLTWNRYDEQIIKEVIEALQQGKIVVYPTDTLYGFGVKVLDKVGVDRLFRLKKRPSTKPMPVIVRDVAMARRFAYIDLRKEKIISALWPGPITVVLPRKDIMPSIVSGGKSTIGLRVPNSEFTRALMEIVDFPITSTSVNFSGEEPLRKVSDITRVFERERYQPHLIVDAGDLPETQASTIIDLTTNKPKILRVGPVKPEELLKILEI